MKVPVDLQAKPWRRALTELDLGLAGVGGIYKNSERLKKYDYSDQIFAETLIVYFNTAEPLEYARIEDLKGKRIGVLRGWSYGDEFDNARKAGLFSAEEVSSDDQNFLKLESMRIDAAIAVSESGATLVSKFRHLRFARSPLSQKPTFLAFSKSSHRTKLLSQFDQTIRAMRKSGEFQEIVAAELAK
jgi:polar amino acid transport system substrate-binding protein